ncbi:hypothetical protein LCGC14_1858350, partial [marine sediment metagenome]
MNQLAKYTIVALVAVAALAAVNGYMLSIQSGTTVEASPLVRDVTAPQGKPFVQGRAPESTPDFRIISIGEHDGQLLLEVEHFRPDGSFWFFENYLWQGREGLKEPKVVNSSGGLYLDDMALAPYTLDGRGERQFYLPDERQWLRTGLPHLDQASILSVIVQTHEQRTVSGWNRGQSRLVEPAIPHVASDQAGVGVLVSRLRNLAGRGFVGGAGRSASDWVGDLPPVSRGLGRLEHGTVSTFFPDTTSGNTTVDGYLRLVINNESWANKQANTGNDAQFSTPTNIVMINGGSASGWQEVSRVHMGFDTSGLGSGATISSATLSFVSTGEVDDFSQAVVLVTSSPATDNILVTGDYLKTNYGGTELAPKIEIGAGITSDSATFNDMTMNAAGRAVINTTGITNLGVMTDGDLDNVEPSFQADPARSRVQLASADEVLAGDKRPKLVVNHETIPATITGTIGDNATEQEVRDGGGTFIVTVAGDTLVEGQAFTDAQQDIIDGLDSAQSEATGWNAEVRDNLLPGSVTRTSSESYTVTMPTTGTEIDGFAINFDEEIAVTIPSSVLVTATEDITGNTTASIFAADESIALTGSVLDTLRPSEIVAGGQVVVVTLAGTTWVASGATFNTQRQAILNGMTADQDGANGWNVRRADFAVSDVVRTSDDVVTVTFSASAAYAIVETETITATVPAAALRFSQS